MSHPTQSLVCADCQSLFRTSRALKIHQQRHQTTFNDVNQPNYNFLSSFLLVAFSSPKFALIAENASLQGHLPLGQFSSKFYRCSTCQISFPCSRSFNYHSITQHERNDREISKEILDEILDEVERFSSSIDDEFQMNLIENASHFGLKRKNPFDKIRRMKIDENRRIYPKCFHPGRTCANLCLNYLISYDDFIRNYSFQIVTQTKGNPFSHGSIVAKSPGRTTTTTTTTTTSTTTTTTTTTTNVVSESNGTKDLLTNENSKRRSIKRAQSSLTDLSQSKRRQTNVESNGKVVDASKRTNSLPRSASSVTLPSKRQRSPTIPFFTQKRRRQRKKPDDDVEQENDDEEISPTKFSKPKQRQASSGSIEYVQVLNNDGQTSSSSSSSSSSLNNIENVKSKSTENKSNDNDDDDVILCRSSSTKSKATVQLDPDEHIRVRCKVCGDIIEGRSRFSKHVLTMHSHLLGKTIPEATQQTTTVR